MEVFYLRRGLWLALSLWVLGLSAWAVETGGDVSLSADELIRRAVHHCNGTTKSKSGFAYTKVSIVEELDSVGNVKERKEKVYEVSCKTGKTYAKLVEVNGHAPAGADLKEQNENDSNARQ